MHCFRPSMISSFPRKKYALRIFENICLWVKAEIVQHICCFQVLWSPLGSSTDEHDRPDENVGDE